MIHVLSQLPSSTTTDDEPCESAISFVMNEPKKNRELPDKTAKQFWLVRTRNYGQVRLIDIIKQLIS